MVGQGALIECLRDPRVEKILVVGRTPIGQTHEKLEELIIDDFMNYGDHSDKLRGYNACYFCLGVTVLGMSLADYARITYDYTIYAGRLLAELNPDMTFIYVSGLGTDDSETGRVMWARIRGRTENRLKAMGFKNAFMFRPGYIQPVSGEKSKTRAFQIVYGALSPFYGVVKRVIPKLVSTSEEVSLAMINATIYGYPKQILYSKDLRELSRIHETAGEPVSEG